MIILHIDVPECVYIVNNLGIIVRWNPRGFFVKIVIDISPLLTAWKVTLNRPLGTHAQNLCVNLSKGITSCSVLARLKKQCDISEEGEAAGDQQKSRVLFRLCNMLLFV